MFDHSGSKIQILAKVLFFIEAGLAVIGGFIFMIQGGIIEGLVLIAGSCAVAYVFSLFLVAFGELVENSAGILYALKKKSDNTSDTGDEKEYIEHTDDASNSSQAVIPTVDLPEGCSRNEKLYLFALRNIEIGDKMHLLNAVKDLELIPGYKDADELLKQCREKLQQK